MKLFDIAFKDMKRSFRSTIAVVFMFGIPLGVTGMFYFMFGNIGQRGEFSLPVTQVIIANLDQGSPNFQLSAADIPGGGQASTLGELVTSVLQNEEMSRLMQVTLAPDEASARAAVDSQKAQVAILIPADFTQQFTSLEGEAVIELYQDPTQTIGPAIVNSILDQFMDGISGAKIAVEVTYAQSGKTDTALVGQVIQQYMAVSQTQMQSQDPVAILLDVRTPDTTKKPANPVVNIIGPIMGAMMIFYAFYTGTATAESILREEEERTLPRLFTTPTPQSTILGGKFLAVFLTVIVQMVVLLIAGRLIFRIEWGSLTSVALTTLGSVMVAATFGIFINSMLKDTKQGGVIFGGVLTMTCMLGMLPIFTGTSPLGVSTLNVISLLVPPGWAVRGLLQSINGLPVTDVLLTTAVMLAWSLALFIIGVLRFNRRYA